MAGSHHTSYILRISGEDSAAEALSITAKREDPPNHAHEQAVPNSAPSRGADNKSVAQDRAPSPVPYQYTPLNDDLKEIRLLTLHGGDFEADIKISIHTAPLTPDDPPTYEALSYVWGSLENPVDINIGFQTLAVTNNLAQALPYLRYRDRPRVLWIDAICINQQDLKERSRQVRRMSDLYRVADRVVVWLGPEKKDSKYGIKVLVELSSKITVNWGHMTMEPTSSGVDDHWADENQELPYGDKELLALYSLISCPWFERLWIWQEIRLAKSNAILICGYDTIPWESFRTALCCLYRKAHLIKQIGEISEQFSARVLKTYPLAHTEWNSTFVYTLFLTRNCKYSNPKDRVYAVLSLLESCGEAVDIEPDYTKRTAQVYQDVTLGYINQRKRLNLLSLSGLNKRLSEMPTWVPDLTVVDYPLLLTYGLASGLSDSEVQYRGAGLLKVTGSISATVQHADRIDTRGPNGLIAEIQRLAPHDVLQGSYIGSCNLITAYCNTLCANEFSDGYLPHVEFLPDFQHSLDLLSAILQPGMKELPDYSPSTPAYKFFKHCAGYLTGRSFFQTREGYIALGLRYAQRGD